MFVKLFDYRVKDLIMRHAKKLKGSGIYINIVTRNLFLVTMI